MRFTANASVFGVSYRFLEDVKSAFLLSGSLKRDITRQKWHFLTIYRGEIKRIVPTLYCQIQT